MAGVNRKRWLLVGLLVLTLVPGVTWAGAPQGNTARWAELWQALSSPAEWLADFWNGLLAPRVSRRGDDAAPGAPKPADPWSKEGPQQDPDGRPARVTSCTASGCLDGTL